MNVDRPSTDDADQRGDADLRRDDPRGSATHADAPASDDADALRSSRSYDGGAEGAELRPSPASTREHDGPADDAPLLDEEQTELFRRRWSDVQGRFVDDPRGAVLGGDALVADLVSELARRFAQHKDGMEEQWSRGDEPSTEELRQALQQYRSFFHRLLNT